MNMCIVCIHYCIYIVYYRFQQFCSMFTTSGRTHLVCPIPFAAANSTFYCDCCRTKMFLPRLHTHTQTLRQSETHTQWQLQLRRDHTTPEEKEHFKICRSTDTARFFNDINYLKIESDVALRTSLARFSSNTPLDGRYIRRYITFKYTNII